MKVAICVATYRRPIMLGQLLDTLRDLDTTAIGAAEVVVVVVDNDRDATAHGLLEQRRASFPFRIVAGLEPERNIALARNECIRLALVEAPDWIAFVDDDERVTPRWLAELLRVRAACDADVVGGPVLNAYDPGVPAWFARSDLPRRFRTATGTVLEGTTTSNVLFSPRVLGLVPGLFDPRFGRTGGSDSHFFMRAARAGARIVWANDAIVHETVPASRATAGWMLRRAFREGNAGVHVARAALPARHWWPRRLAGAGYRIARGVVALPFAVARGRAAVVLALQDACHGAGALAAMGRYRYVEYRQPHGA